MFINCVFILCILGVSKGETFPRKSPMISDRDGFNLSQVHANPMTAFGSVSIRSIRLNAPMDSIKSSLFVSHEGAMSISNPITTLYNLKSPLSNSKVYSTTQSIRKPMAGVHSSSLSSLNNFAMGSNESSARHEFKKRSAMK